MTNKILSFIVLQMDVHRALTELDAQAKEYEELKRETKSTAV